jgi:hypothetical protein
MAATASKLLERITLKQAVEFPDWLLSLGAMEKERQTTHRKWHLNAYKATY